MTCKANECCGFIKSTAVSTDRVAEHSLHEAKIQCGSSREVAIRSFRHFKETLEAKFGPPSQSLRGVPGAN